MPPTPSHDTVGPEARSETLSIVTKILERSLKPLTADDIQEDIPDLYQLKKQDLVRLLQQEAAGTRTLYRWSAGPGSRKERYWHQDETAYFRERILSALSLQMRNKADLVEIVKKEAVPCSKSRLTSIVHTTLADLIKEKMLFEVPPWGNFRKIRYANRPPDLGLYLEKTRKAFDDACRKLKKYGIDAGGLFAAFEKQLPLSSTKRPAYGATDEQKSPPPQPQPDISEAILNRMLRTMIQIVPGAKKQAPVWIPDLRNALDLPKNVFDRAVLMLAKQGKVFLNRHAHPAQMSDAEKETMIPDGQGNFYVVVVLREGNPG